MLKFIAIGMTIGCIIPWDNSGYPYLPIGRIKWLNVRERVIKAQGNNKSILDIGCGIGFSTSSSERCLGIDTDHKMLEKAKNLFPEKDFEHGDILHWKRSRKFDVVTSMFVLHNVPRDIRKKLIQAAKLHANERTVILDFAPDFVPSQELCERYPHVKNYLKHCREDMSEFTEHVIVKGRLHMWILEKGSNTYFNSKDDETVKQILRMPL